MPSSPATTMSVCELATIVAEDPDLELLLLYLEGIPDPWHLAQAAQVARERDLPVVVLKSGRTMSDGLSQELQAFVKSRLAPHKYPRAIEFIGDLPKTATGKIQRFRLRELEASRQH